MSTQVQRRRGTTAQHASFTGVVGELTVDTTKKTVVVHDGSTAGGIPLAREDMGGDKITNLGTPSAAGDAATKSYVDSVAAGLKWKTSVIAATTAAGTLASSFENGDTVDGVTLTTGDRILIKNQADGTENGIYTVNASGAPTRASDADSGAELVSSAVFVDQGTANADKAFVCTNNAITLGSTSVTFTAFASVIGALIASNNLSDVASASTARANIGVGAIGTLATMAAQLVVVMHVTATGLQVLLPIRIPFAVTGWDIIADASGSAVLDVWKAAGAVPTNSDSLCSGGGKPTLSSQQLVQAGSVGSWSSVAFSAGDVAGIEVESFSGVGWIALTIYGTRAA